MAEAVNVVYCIYVTTNKCTLVNLKQFIIKEI
jgi:hypothetical protein